MSSRAVFATLVLALGTLALGAPSASAQVGVFSVNSNGDTSDLNAGNNTCDTGGLVGGSPECTLRAAIEEANAKVGVDFIVAHPFIATDANGFVQITPQSPLPAITESAILDFDGAAGYDSGDPFATPIFQLDGSQAGTGTSVHGIEISGTGAFGSSVSALAVHGFAGSGIYATADFVYIQGCQIGVANGQLAAGTGGNAVWMLGNDAVVGQSFNVNSGWVGKGNVISANSGYALILNGDDGLAAGNRIGTDPSGTSAMGNASFAVAILGDRNAVGAVGTLTAGGDVPSGNVIADNLYGVGVFSPSTDTTIEANLIGTDAAGAVDLGNTQVGVYVASDDTTVGSVGPGANLISGNDSAGIYVEHVGTIAFGISIVGNLVGVTADESSSLGNGGPGILSIDASGIRINDNVIGGNTGHGVQALGHQAVVSGNLLGTNANGDDLGNGGHGILLVDAPNSRVGSLIDPPNTISFNAGHGVFVDGSFGAGLVYGNTIGSGTLGENAGNGLDGVYVTSSTFVQMIANTIGENGGNGISVAGGTASAGNPIVANSMFGNGGIGIDLAADGPTPNDIGDGDVGENQLQNSPAFEPQFTKYNSGTGQIEIVYRVDTNLGEAGYPLRIDFYLADADGEEGEVYLETDWYPAVSAGVFRSFAFTPPAGYDYEDEMILATAMDLDNNSSEFSDPEPLPEPKSLMGLACGGLLLVGLERRRRCGRA